jgi:hypothetical protein
MLRKLFAFTYLYIFPYNQPKTYNFCSCQCTQDTFHPLETHYQSKPSDGPNLQMKTEQHSKITRFTFLKILLVTICALTTDIIKHLIIKHKNTEQNH